MSCLSKEHRLNSSREFNKLYKSGKKWHTSTFVAFFSSNQKIKAGFVSSKKSVGNAVLRNKARRKMRAVFLSYEEKIKDGNYIFVAKEGINEKSHNDLKRDFEFALKRLDVLK